MKILAVSDEESPYLWEHYVPGRLKEYDLIISAGDLKPDYLSFLVTMARCPVLFVHGNHDEVYDSHPPEGCDCIDDSLVIYNGVRILGLGGCMRYHPGNYQYSEQEMVRKIRKIRHVIKKAGGVDILVTHSPARGLGDRDDPAHIGFTCFRDLLSDVKPPLMLHGHVHPQYDFSFVREHFFEDTRIINVSDRFVIEVPEADHDPKEHNKIIWKTKHKFKDFDPWEKNSRVI